MSTARKLGLVTLFSKGQNKWKRSLVNTVTNIPQSHTHSCPKVIRFLEGSQLAEKW